jgi:hypothetical protein
MATQLATHTNKGYRSNFNYSPLGSVFPAWRNSRHSKTPIDAYQVGNLSYISKIFARKHLKVQVF